MCRVRFMGRDIVRTKFSTRNVVPGPTKYVDPGTSLCKLFKKMYVALQK